MNERKSLLESIHTPESRQWLYTDKIRTFTCRKIAINELQK